MQVGFVRENKKRESFQYTNKGSHNHFDISYEQPEFGVIIEKSN